MTHSLEDWIVLQRANIASTQAIIARALAPCNAEASEIDTETLELLVSNVVMHIDIICQYEHCIEARIQCSEDIPQPLAELHALNNKALYRVQQQFTLLQTLAQEKTKDLYYKAAHTSLFIGQLI